MKISNEAKTDNLKVSHLLLEYRQIFHSHIEIYLARMKITFVIKTYTLLQVS